MTRESPDDAPIMWPADAPVPLPRRVPELSSAARAGLGRWCSTVRMGVHERGLVLSPLMIDADARIRHTVVRHAPRRLVGELCYDADGHVAASAMRHWSLAGEHGVPSRPEDERLVQKLARSPHAPVRRMAAEEWARTDPWDARRAEARLAARQRLATNREAFIEELRLRAAQGEAAGRVDAMRLARAIGVAEAIEVELLRAATGAMDGLDEEPDRWRVAATAVAALADADTTSARQAIEACLRHRADRVRANAIEASMRSARRRGHVTFDDRLHELKLDEHHRVRATALREFLRGDGTRASLVDPSAAQGVADMLSDERPMHRVAGLWLAERLLPTGRNASLSKRWAELSVRIAELARGDEDARVRARGGRCARRLLAQMRSGWRTRAPALSIQVDEPEEGTVETAGMQQRDTRGAA